MKKLFLFVVLLLATIYHSSSQVDMSRKIVLTTSSGATLDLRFRAAANMTPIKLQNQYDRPVELNVGSSWSEPYTISAGNGNQVTIYGNIDGLDCTGNSDYPEFGVQAIDIQANSNLKVLYCEYNTISKLDFANATQIQEVYCQNNRINSINIRGCNNLNKLVCYYNQFTTLDLDTLYCALPQGTPARLFAIYPLNYPSDDAAIITATNAQNARDKFWAVRYYFSGDNNNEEIQTTGNYQCQGSSLNLNKYITLSLNPQANVYYFKIKAATPNTPIRVVYGNETRDLSIGTDWSFQEYPGGLSEIKIYGDVVGLNIGTGNNNDMFTNVNLSNNSDLEELLCANAGLSTLDVTNSTKLKKLHCQDNRFTGLNIRNNTQLEEVAFFGNQFSTFTVDTIYCALRQIPAGTTQGKCYPALSETSETTADIRATNAQNARNKNWQVLYYSANTTGANGIQTTGTYVCGSPEPSVNMSKYITVTLNPQAPDYRVKIKAANANTLVRFVRGNNTENATIGTDWFTKGFPGGDSELKIYGDITGLDINGGNNVMTALDLTHNSDLEELLCPKTGLSTLDVTNSTKLKKLHCQDNRLTGLNIRNNNQLSELVLYGNQFSKYTIDTIYCALPNASATQSKVIYPLNSIGDTDNEMVLTTNANNATNKGWKVKYFYGGSSDEMNIQTTGTYVCGSPEPSVNMNKYITLNVVSGKAIKLNLKAQKDNTLVRIVSGNTSKDILVGSKWYSGDSELDSNFRVTANASTLTIYGDIVGLSCNNNNENLTGMSLENNKELTELYCETNHIASLDVSKNTALTDLYLENNKLLYLDVSKNTELVTLSCGFNQLASLNVSNNVKLKKLRLRYNKITSLDVSKNRKLEYLSCFVNQISSIDVSNNRELRILSLYKNNLTYVDVSNLTKLEYFNCASNQLTDLKITNCPSLRELWIKRNNFTTEKYDEIYCDLPQLPENEEGKCVVMINSADVNRDIIQASNGKNARSKGWILEYSNIDIPVETFGYYQCGEPTPNMNTFITLHVQSGNQIKLNFKPIRGSGLPIRIESGNNSINRYLSSDWENEINVMATSERITIYGDIIGFDCRENFENIRAIDVSNNTMLTELICSKNRIPYIDVSNNTKLTTLDMYENELVHVDVSKNVALTKLDINSNNIQSLDVSKNIHLQSLQCGRNKIASLDVSKNVALTQLICHDNEFTTLDVSRNTELEHLVCGENKITNLDISRNRKLRDLSFDHNNFSTEVINRIYCDLPDHSNSKFKGRCSPIDKNNDNNRDNVLAATSDNARKKNWNVTYKGLTEDVPSNGNYDCNSGVDESLASGISVFPNPATSKVQIKLDESVNETLILVDLTGRAVLLTDVISGEATIDVSNLTAGTYFIRIGNITKKLTVK